MDVAAHILSRNTYRHGASETPWVADLRLARGRVHELCGPARRLGAIWLAQNLTGPVIWIAPGWERERLNGEALACHIDPARVIFVSPQNELDLLWTMEEALRNGHIPLVVAALETAPNMTATRRLHLAAQGGGGHTLGLMLTPGEGGAPGVETRWHLAQDHGRDTLPPPAADGHGRAIAAQTPPPAWHLSRRRARALPPKEWRILSNSQGTHIAKPLGEDQSLASPALKGIPSLQDANQEGQNHQKV